MASVAHRLCCWIKGAPACATAGGEDASLIDTTETAQILVQPVEAGAAGELPAMVGPPPGYKKNRRCSVSAEVVNHLAVQAQQEVQHKVVEKSEEARARIQELVKRNVLMAGARTLLGRCQEQVHSVAPFIYL